MVPGAGLEPARLGRGILSPLCLPIPPSGRGLLCSWPLLRRQGAGTGGPGVARRAASRYTAQGSAVARRPGKDVRFRAALLCPGHAARPLLSGRKAGKAHRDTCRGRHGLSGSCEGTAAQGCFGARRPRGIPFATDRRAGAEARHPLGSSFGLSPLSSMAVAARVRGRGRGRRHL